MEVTKEELQNFLKRIGLAASLVATFNATTLSAIDHVEHTVLPAIQGMQAVDSSGFHDGPCYIEYKGREDELEQELQRSNFFAVFSVVAKPSIYHDELVGSHEELAKALDDFSYVRLSRGLAHGANFSMQIFLVPVPSSPDEIKGVEERIVDNSSFFFFPDETRTFNTANYRRGKGFRHNG